MVLTTDVNAVPANKTVVFTNKTAREIITLLEEKGHTKAVIIGGSLTMSEFVKAGLVDGIYFVMEPVIFGSGLPLLNNLELELKLNLLEVRKLNTKTVQLHYEIINFKK